MNNLLTAEFKITPPPYRKSDSISDKKEIWALNVEVEGYTSRLIRVIRTSDSAEMDILPTEEGYLDTAELLSFAGANTCEVMLIAGQKGFSGATATAGNRPIIVNAGALVTENGRPAMLFDGISDHFTATLPYSASASVVSISAIETQHSATGVGFVVGNDVITTGNQIYFYNSFNYLIAATNRLLGTRNIIASNGTGANVTNLVTSIADRSNINLYLNGTLDSSTSDLNSDYTTSTNIVIGSQTGSSNFFDGTMQYISVGLTDESSVQSLLYDELNQRYNIDGAQADNPITQYRYAATETYVTKSTDTLANTVFIGSMSKNFSIRKEIGHFIWGNQSQTTIGSMTLINNDGRYDEFYDLSMRDATITFKIIKQGESFDTAIQVGEYKVDQVSNNNDNYIEISFTDKLALLDKNTLNPNFSGAIPFVNNRNLPMPVPFGFIYQAPLSIVDSTTNQYHLMPEYSASDKTNVEATILAKDRANPFILNTDYTVLQLTDTGGMGIDLTGPNDGTITADYMGYRYNGNNTNTFENFVGKLLVDYGGLDVSDIDFTTAAQIDTDLGYNYGYYSKQGDNIKSILDQAVASHCGFYYQKNNGKIAFAELKEPDVTSVYDINSINLAAGVKVSIDTAPGLTDSVASLKNWHVYTYDEVRDIGGLSEEDKQAASSEFREYSVLETTTSGGFAFENTYSHARNGCYLPTLLTSTGNGASLALQMESLFGKVRKNHDTEFLIDDIFFMLTLDLNDTIKLTHDRYGLDSGKNLRLTVLEIPNALNKKVNIRGWG